MRNIFILSILLVGSVTSLKAVDCYSRVGLHSNTASEECTRVCGAGGWNGHWSCDEESNCVCGCHGACSQ